MRSLSAKLTLAFLLVGVAGALLVAVLLRWQTERQLDRFIRAWYGDEVTALQTQLEAYYRANESWAGIRSVTIREGSPSRLRTRPWELVTLVAPDGTIVSPGPRGDVGERLTAGQLSDGTPIEVDGQTVGWLLFDVRMVPGRPIAASPEATLLANVQRATLWSAVGAAGLALVAGAFLAHTITRPVRDLTRATQALARGELDQQVPVRTNDEIGELAMSFNRMSADLARATRLRRQMTADIAHDLRTPLSALLGYTEALSEGKFEGSPEIYSILHQEAQHLQRLVDDLRTLSLADAGELPLYREPTSARVLLERVARTYGAQAAAQEIAMEVAVAEDAPVVAVDPQRMAQVLGNLVQNALRYTPAGGRIVLSAERADGQVLLQVRDTGSGIAPEDLPFIWERSYRGDKARGQDGSSGLGLAIARSIVEAHGGSIGVESRLGQGSTFTITLPPAAPDQLPAA